MKQITKLPNDRVKTVSKVTLSDCFLVLKDRINDLKIHIKKDFYPYIAGKKLIAKTADFFFFIILRDKIQKMY